MHRHHAKRAGEEHVEDHAVQIKHGDLVTQGSPDLDEAKRVVEERQAEDREQETRERARERADFERMKAQKLEKFSDMRHSMGAFNNTHVWEHEGRFYIDSLKYPHVFSRDLLRHGFSYIFSLQLLRFHLQIPDRQHSQKKT